MTDYYHPRIETMPRKALDKLQEGLLRKICRHAWNMETYRRLWSQSGFTSAPSSREEFSKLPFISKDVIVDGFPYGFCAVPRDELARLYLTSGSSGRPAGVLLSRSDIDALANFGARSLMMRGVRPGDVYQMTLAYGLWAAGLSGHASAERLGCLVIPAGPGNTQRQIWLMKTMGTTVLNAVPSYHLRIAQVGEEMGVDFSKLPLRVALSTAGRLEPSTRKEIQERLDAELFNSYGTTETGGIGNECEAHDGLHVWHDVCLLEVVDPKTGEQVAAGEVGEIVVTTLQRFTMPLVRYRTGDRGKVLSEEPCACGRTHQRISEDISRLDDMLKIRGVLVSPSTVERIVKHCPELSGNFLIQVRPRSHPALICELNSWVRTAFEDELVKAVAAELKNKTGLTFEVKLVRPGELPAERGEKRVQIIPDLPV